mmetsp:Transcript_15157/g.47135  ORF Transcript_15157/g.47135 Transcript_15157/m.47135 type:complete len:347 (-) Transcript_15157:140-1180(-)
MPHGVRAEEQRAGHLLDQHVAIDKAAHLLLVALDDLAECDALVASGARSVGVARLRVGCRQNALHELGDPLGGAVARVLRLATRPFAVDADGGEALHVLGRTKLLVRHAVHVREHHLLRAVLLAQLARRVMPDGLEHLAPCAPLGHESDHHELGAVHDLVEVVRRDFVAVIHLEGVQHVLILVEVFGSVGIVDSLYCLALQLQEGRVGRLEDRSRAVHVGAQALALGVQAHLADAFGTQRGHAVHVERVRAHGVADVQGGKRAAQLRELDLEVDGQHIAIERLVNHHRRGDVGGEVRARLAADQEGHRERRERREQRSAECRLRQVARQLAVGVERAHRVEEAHGG